MKVSNIQDTEESNVAHTSSVSIGTPLAKFGFMPVTPLLTSPYAITVRGVPGRRRPARWGEVRHNNCMFP